MIDELGEIEDFDVWVVVKLNFRVHIDSCCTICLVKLGCFAQPCPFFLLSEITTF